MTIDTTRSPLLGLRLVRASTRIWRPGFQALHDAQKPSAIPAASEPHFDRLIVLEAPHAVVVEIDGNALRNNTRNLIYALVPRRWIRCYGIATKENQPMTTAALNGTAKKNAKLEQPSAPDVEEIKIPAMDLRETTIRLEGQSPLIVHAWSEKARQMMRDSQQKKARQKAAAKVPADEYRDAMYLIERNPDVHGIPILAFKAAAGASWSMADMKKAMILGSFHHINHIATAEGDLVPIRFESIRMREDMVRVGMGVADICYRPEYTGWSVDIAAKYNARVISLPQLLALLDVAGFAVGIGEQRPAKGGSNGMFKVGSILS